MEDVIQILVFIIIVVSVIIGKYKEVNANRPGQTVRKTNHRAGGTAQNEKEFDDDFSPLFEETDDFEEYLDKFERCATESPKKKDVAPNFDEMVEEPVTMMSNWNTQSTVTDSSSSWQDLQSKQAASPLQSEISRKLQEQKTVASYRQEVMNRTTTSSHQVSEPTIKPAVRPSKKTRVRLKTREEARQAFIYAEIFNRKYE